MTTGRSVHARPLRKRPRSPSQDVAVAVHRLREVGLVPWEWIVDETRSLHRRRYAESVYMYISDALENARIDLWDGEAPPLILCESRSLAGVLQHIASDYLCPIAATNGQSGGFLHTDIAPLVAQSRDAGSVLRVLYFGDYDLSGGHIEENTYEVLCEYGSLDWQRRAITAAQIRDNNLTATDKRDHRFKPARTFPAVETEALRQSLIQRILTDALDDMVVVPLADARAEEERQRERLRDALSKF